jgi:hypothetical protein
VITLIKADPQNIFKSEEDVYFSNILLLQCLTLQRTQPAHKGSVPRIGWGKFRQGERQREFCGLDIWGPDWNQCKSGIFLESFLSPHPLFPHSLNPECLRDFKYLPGSVMNLCNENAYKYYRRFIALVWNSLIPAGSF